MSAERQRQPDLPPKLAERIAEQREIAAENGRRILANPRLALRALAHAQATFTAQDIAKYLSSRTYGAEQFNAAYLKVTAAADLALQAKPQTLADIDLLQQKAAERWQEKQHARHSGLSSEPHPEPAVSEETDLTEGLNADDRHRPTYEGPEDDLDI